MAKHWQLLPRHLTQSMCCSVSGPVCPVSGCATLTILLLSASGPVYPLVPPLPSSCYCDHSWSLHWWPVFCLYDSASYPASPVPQQLVACGATYIKTKTHHFLQLFTKIFTFSSTTISRTMSHQCVPSTPSSSPNCSDFIPAKIQNFPNYISHVACSIDSSHYLIWTSPASAKDN